MRRALLVFGLTLGVLLLGVLLLWNDSQPVRVDARASIRSLLGPGDDAGFARALPGGEISLPRDHGPHPAYRSEWWYFTGNLFSPAGREFGFQLTFFRFALAPAGPARTSAWASNQIYMAHFAITDVAAADHRVAERLARGSAGVAGARAAPFEVWLDDWSARSPGAAFLPLRLSATDAATGMALELELAPGKGPVLQGEQGLSAKGSAPGNASWYYSYPRLPATGRLSLDGESHTLSGFAWLDREWSTSSLDAGVVGWDWFSLQLDDGRDLMLYSLRQADGEPAPQSAGSLTDNQGKVRRLSLADFRLQPIATWSSAATGVNWPVAWRVTLPGEQLDLLVRAAVRDQEQDLSVRYWEGTVDIFPPDGSARIGRGYMELTGYRPLSANSAP